MFIQIKAIRKGIKPPIWRRAYVPLDINFAKMAYILETMLELPVTQQYEFEFFKDRIRLIEWDKEDSPRRNYQFEYHDAAKASVNDWMMQKTSFTFRVKSDGLKSEGLKSEGTKTDVLKNAGAKNDGSKNDESNNAVAKKTGEDLPQYKIEIEHIIEKIVRDDKEQKPLAFPLIVKETSFKGDPFWTDPNVLNRKLEETCFLTEGDAEYPSIATVCERIGQGKGIVFSQNLESQDSLLFDYMQEEIARLTDNIKRLEKELEKLRESFAEGAAPAGKAAEGDAPAGKPAEDAAPAGKAAKAKAKAVTMDSMFGAYSKENLLEIAELFDVSLRKTTKAKMAFELARHFLEPGIMRGLMLELSEEQLDAFEAAIQRGRYLPSEEEIEMLEDVHDLYYIVKYNNGKIEVPEDAAAIYGIIRANGYREFHRKARWLIDCLSAFSELYVVGNVSLLYKLYRRSDRGAGDRGEFDDILAKIPEELKDCVKIGKKIVHKEALRDEIYKSIEQRQREVPYYIPSEREILEYSELNYPASDPVYVKLFEFFRDDLKLEEADCEELCYLAYRTFTTGGMLSDLMDHINQRDIVFDSVKMMERFARLAMEVSNNTRRFEFRGHTPLEMGAFADDRPATGRPRIVPMSSLAAEMLEEGRDRLSAMGVDIDTEETAARIPAMSMPGGISGGMRTGTRKIYPNDPCPCGSGKKYKKCCGTA